MENNEQYKISLNNTPNEVPQEIPEATPETSFSSFDGGFSMGDVPINNDFNTTPVEPSQPNDAFQVNNSFNMGDTSNSNMNTNEPMNNAFTTDDISNGIKNGANNIIGSLGFQKGGDNKKAFTDLLKSLFIPMGKETLFVNIGAGGVTIAIAAGLIYAVLPYIMVLSPLLKVIRNIASVATTVGLAGMAVKKQWIPCGVTLVTDILGNAILVSILNKIFTAIYY